MPEVFLCRLCPREIDKDKDKYVVVHTRGDGVQSFAHADCVKKERDKLAS